MGENSEEGQLLARGRAGEGEADCRVGASDHGGPHLCAFQDAGDRSGLRALAITPADAVLLEKLNRRSSEVAHAPVAKAVIIRRVERRFRDRLIEQATFGLEKHEPQFSARPVLTKAQQNVFVALALAIIVSVVLAPRVGELLIVGVVAASYLANAIFRGWLFWVGSDHVSKKHEHVQFNSQADLPGYTILVPLHREANIVPQLISSLRSIDYPAERLDVKLVVEEDDIDTVEAVHRANADGAFEILHVPAGEPRTKPRACNYALQFARGEFLVIYDAEDQPEPDQLKKAVHAFRTGPTDVACLQARLNFFNARECWIARGMLAQKEKKNGRTMPSFRAWKPRATSMRSGRSNISGRRWPARSQAYRPALTISAVS